MAASPGEFYVRQDRLTDPGALARLFDGLPDRPPDLRNLVSQLIIHVAWAANYAIPPGTRMPRDTIPVADRLGLIASSSAGPLSTLRPPEKRTFGTCRDYALMLCSLLRHHSIPARVRCGFATYFSAAPYEDHWICEYWSAVETRWVRTDAQLDQLQRDQLGVRFDCADLPNEAFLTAGQAWRLARSGAADPGAFGHGNDRGWWFLRVNVHRDLLALTNRQVSAWDSWRNSTEPGKALGTADFASVDRLAEASETVAGAPDRIAIFEEIAARSQTPPWQA